MMSLDRDRDRDRDAGGGGRSGDAGLVSLAAAPAPRGRDEECRRNGTDRTFHPLPTPRLVREDEATLRDVTFREHIVI